MFLFQTSKVILKLSMFLADQLPVGSALTLTVCSGSTAALDVPKVCVLGSLLFVFAVPVCPLPCEHLASLHRWALH